MSRARGGGVSSEARHHGADKTRSQQPFSPLEEVDYSYINQTNQLLLHKIKWHDWVVLPRQGGPGTPQYILIAQWKNWMFAFLR